MKSQKSDLLLQHHTWTLIFKRVHEGTSDMACCRSRTTRDHMIACCVFQLYSVISTWEMHHQDCMVHWASSWVSSFCVDGRLHWQSSWGRWLQSCWHGLTWTKLLIEADLSQCILCKMRHVVCNWLLQSAFHRISSQTHVLSGSSWFSISTCSWGMVHVASCTVPLLFRHCLVQIQTVVFLHFLLGHLICSFVPHFPTMCLLFFSHHLIWVCTLKRASLEKKKRFFFSGCVFGALNGTWLLFFICM